MAIIGYARVSTTEQSLDVQDDNLRAAGATKIFSEKLSGIDRDRPQLAALIDYAREGDTVVVTRLDRIARSTKHLLDVVETLECKGCAFKVLNLDLDTSTATGKLMLTLLGAIATFERALMLERQAEGIAKAQQEGRYKGRQPTARARAKDVHALVTEGKTKRAIAEQLGIGIASVYRILRAAK